MNDVKSAFCGLNFDKRECGDKGICDTLVGLGEFELFCTPGHKGALDSDDVTEFDGESLFPAGSVRFAEREIAAHYGVSHARMLVCGASMGIKAAIMAVGGDIVMPAFTHKSAFSGAELARVNAFTFDCGASDGLPKVPTTEQCVAAIKAHASAKALLITSPDYFGRCAPVGEIAVAAKELGVKLIVDAAHGAHFATDPELFPMGAEKYADIAVLSAHKTLRTLTQAAIGTVNDDSLIDAYDRATELLGTTSPSYRLLASVESGVRYERENKRRYLPLISALKQLRAGVKCLDNDDPLRIVVDARDFRMDGQTLNKRLIERRVMPETYYGDYCVFIITLSDDAAKVDHLKRVLLGIKGERHGR